MRLGITIFWLLLLSCRDNAEPHSWAKKDGKTVTADTRKKPTDSTAEIILPVLFSTGSADTVISFSVEELSAEGGDIKAHYLNDTIVEARWNLYGETGKTTIEYIFLTNGKIQVNEKQYFYKARMSEMRSSRDMILKDTINYFLDTSGLFRSYVDKDFTNVFRYFKTHVPLVLKRR